MRALIIVALLLTGCPDADTGSDAGTTDTIGGGTADSEVATPDCTSAADCDDGISCTDDQCFDGGCTWVVATGSCLIGGNCYSEGDPNPANVCQQCLPTAKSVWSPMKGGSACDDDDACTQSSACEKGNCEGPGINCDDGSPCTADDCDPATGCVTTHAADGTTCEDSTGCMVDPVCQTGQCFGLPRDCDDENPCTEDHCAAGGGCVSTMAAGPCEDGDLCTVGDQCDDGVCRHGPVDDCDDGNQCTKDGCDSGLGCFNLPVQSACCIGESTICDDGNPCTTETCDPETLECASEPTEGSCDDGDACTGDDVCADDICAGTPLTCDDGNPCTVDSCSQKGGCAAVAVSGEPCDDGLNCTVETACVNGQCVGDDSGCSCEPDGFGDAAKVTFAALGTTGKAGEGLDVDGKADTCLPAGNCDSGIDNAFSLLAGLANPPLVDAVAAGDLMLIAELPIGASGSFDLAMHQGKLAPSSKDCDFQAATCDYLVDSAGLNQDTCKPLYLFPATRDGDTITAGGPGSTLPFLVPIQGGVVLEVAVHSAQIKMEVVEDAAGNITAISGVLGGAIRKVDLEAAIDLVPDESLPLDKETIKQFLSILPQDIDTTGDGAGDASSVGIKLSGIDAVLVGVD